MIARLWHGRTKAIQADAYLEYLNKTGIPDYKATPGNRGVMVMTRIEGDVTHFMLLTLWESMDAIRHFAGDDVNRARYYPEDSAYLLEFEPYVTHYEVFDMRLE
jgi:hypothetical protein